MPVVAAKSSILSRWHDGTERIEIRSDASIDSLFRLANVSVRRPNPDLLLPDPITLWMWPTPQGVAVSIQDCESEEDIIAVVDAIASALETAGVEAVIEPVPDEEVPFPYPQNDGFSAAMTLQGEPYWGTPTDPAERRGDQRLWDPDPGVLAKVIEHAVNWCEVQGGGLWITSGTTAFKTPRERAVSVLTRLLDADPSADLVAARDDGWVRRVGFERNGYVIYEVGGTQQPEWQICVNDLTSVLVDLHQYMTWGFVQKRPVGRCGIGPATTLVTHEALWEPYEDQVAGFGRISDPRRFENHVLNVYGIQVLGPSHDTGSLAGDWDIKPLDAGWTLVSSRSPSRWFAGTPTLQTLLDSRGSFGELVDPIWSPTRK
ncbi:hypothetical protein [Aeromicrobium sp. 9AM]|uniref:hypothetical protein n=1 Tax=Aeromicrobium sp. 9AM TaxID=2653126 RepID=UPI0012F328DD|nr:hypothetical protein [Aeromicrobium sp. 9AM]VXB90358.1 hypothetical protein AERO9AM_30135 [Aeromicrobium sp. 9AM]